MQTQETKETRRETLEGVLLDVLGEKPTSLEVILDLIEDRFPRHVTSNPQWRTQVLAALRRLRVSEDVRYVAAAGWRVPGWGEPAFGIED